MKRAFIVRGLDCAEEIEALRRTVGPLPGVQSLDFDLLRAVLTVVTDGQSPDDESILAAIRAAGLAGSLAGPDRGADAAQDRQRRARLAACVASGLLTAGGFAAHSLLHGGVVHALAAGEAAAHTFPPVAIALYVAAILAGGWHIAPRAWAALRRRQPDMNLLMTIAVVGAMSTGQWFEAATVTFLFSLALSLESWSVARARRAIEALLRLSPVTARVVCPHDGDVNEKPVEAVAVGDLVAVRPGERIPLDGQIVEGETTVNQAPITGESAPVPKGPGAEVFAGTINNDGAFRFEVSRAFADTTLARIIRMVEEARSRRAPVEEWVNRFARFYTPAMILVAVLIAVLPPVFGGEWARWFYQGLVMLVIACPCALVISTPVSIVAALTSAARHGVLIKGGIYLEIPSRLRVVAMDKTGTLTRGHPEVQAVIPLDGHTPEELLATAAALESHSDHPLARAVLRHAERSGVAPRTASGFQALRGKGAEAVIDGRHYWLGSHRFLHELGLEREDIHRAALELEDAGHSVLAIGNDRHVCGLISVADGVRPEARAAVRALLDAGVGRVVMLTGDNQGTAAAVAAETGVSEFHAELMPEDKINEVRSLVRNYGQVAMVGDGVNDAPAMAAATLGIAMGGGGTDAAIETADVTLMADDLSRLPWLIRHSRRALRTIRQNIFFALGTKALFMALAVAGLATLWMAIAADMGASLLVIFNGLRLLRD